MPKTLLVGALLSVTLLLPFAAAAQCVGDCNGDDEVTVDELLRAISIALGNETLSACEAIDRDMDGLVFVDEILAAVNEALCGCGRPCAEPTPAATPTPVGQEIEAPDLAAGVVVPAVLALSDVLSILSTPPPLVPRQALPGLTCPGGGTVAVVDCQSINTAESTYEIQLSSCAINPTGLGGVLDGTVFATFVTFLSRCPVQVPAVSLGFPIGLSPFIGTVTYGSGSAATVQGSATLNFFPDGSLSVSTPLLRINDQCVGMAEANTQGGALTTPAGSACPQGGTLEVVAAGTTSTVTFTPAGIDIDRDNNGVVDDMYASCAAVATLGCGP
jgi:hypothetical protein